MEAENHELASLLDAVRVDSKGYAGANDLHILSAKFRKFCSDLISFQQTLKDKAVPGSIAHEEPRIAIAPFDGFGHMSVIGNWKAWSCVT